MGDGGLHALGQQDGDAVSLFDALGLQHVGTAVGEALEIAKAVARLAAVGVEMDERQTIRVGPPVAGVDSEDRKRVVWGKRGSVRVELGGRRIYKKKKQK